MNKLFLLIMSIVLPCAVHAATVNYTYDLAGRLTQAQYNNGTTITYTYDPAGNMLSREVVTASVQANASIQDGIKALQTAYPALSAQLAWIKQETVQVFKQALSHMSAWQNQYAQATL